VVGGVVGTGVARQRLGCFVQPHPQWVKAEGALVGRGRVLLVGMGPSPAWRRSPTSACPARPQRPTPGPGLWRRPGRCPATPLKRPLRRPATRWHARPPGRTTRPARAGPPCQTGSPRHRRWPLPDGSAPLPGHGCATRSRSRPSPATWPRSTPTGPPPRPATRSRMRHQTLTVGGHLRAGDTTTTVHLHGEPSFWSDSVSAKRIFPVQESSSADRHPLKRKPDERSGLTPIPFS
jgi:hypothetical protein